MEHKEGKGIITRKYNVTKLVYYEQTNYVPNAIMREKKTN